MFTASAELYDTIYSSFKDYGAEADRIVALLRTEHPACRRLLDVGCGTGEHARLLTAHGFQVDGLDLDPSFVGLAAQKNPLSRFHVADMCSFALSGRYDAVLSLFSSIGYAKSIEGVVRALICSREHLAPGGIVVVEPWLTPDSVRPGHTTPLTVDRPPLRVVRTSRLDVMGTMSRVTFEYEVTRPEGVTHATEHHELGLFTVDEMIGAFAAAGLSVSYDPAGLTGRGLYLGRAAA